MMAGFKQLGLREKATAFSALMESPGWALLKVAFKPEIRTRITDTDAKEAFVYEAIRAQVIQEIFSTPALIIRQAEREWGRLHPTRDDRALETPLIDFDESHDNPMASP